MSCMTLLNLVHGCFVAHVHEFGELNSNQYIGRLNYIRLYVHVD